MARSPTNTSVRYSCIYCGKKIGRPSDLRRHHLTHEKDPQFKCAFPGCSYGSHQKSNLKNHIKSRHSYQSFNCTVPGCLRTYKDVSSVIRHEKKHHGFYRTQEQDSSSTRCTGEQGMKMQAHEVMFDHSNDHTSTFSEKESANSYTQTDALGSPSDYSEPETPPQVTPPLDSPYPLPVIMDQSTPMNNMGPVKFNALDLQQYYSPYATTFDDLPPFTDPFPTQIETKFVLESSFWLDLKTPKPLPHALS